MKDVMNGCSIIQKWEQDARGGVEILGVTARDKGCWGYHDNMSPRIMMLYREHVVQKFVGDILY